MITKVEGWETQDGRFFKDEDQAKTHALKIEKTINRKRILSEKSEWIRQYIANEVADQGLKLEDIGEPFTMSDDWGWNCESDKNPIDKCVYTTFEGHYDECCCFCGEPEERK